MNIIVSKSISDMRRTPLASHVPSLMFIKLHEFPLKSWNRPAMSKHSCINIDLQRTHKHALFQRKTRLNNICSGHLI